MRSRLHRNRQGSKQYQSRNRGHWKFWLAAWFLLVLLACLIGAHLQTVGRNKAYAEMLISPLAANPFVSEAIGMKPLTPEQEQDWEAMKRMAHKLAPLYDYPAKVIIAQMALESGRGTSHYCIERNNCFGMNAIDSDPDQAFWYGNKEQAIIDYMIRIKKYYSEAYAARSNPDRMIELIKAGGYATDPDYVSKLRSLPEWSE